jgi:hypothetical protein
MRRSRFDFVIVGKLLVANVAAISPGLGRNLTRQRYTISCNVLEGLARIVEQAEIVHRPDRVDRGPEADVAR